MVHILLVEDDQDLNRTVCHYLNAHNYQTKGVLSAQDAFDALYAARYDLILSDIMMPGMDGFVFAEAVRRQDKNIPILFMTARDDFTSKERGFRLGIDDYVVKPVNLDELVLRIEALLRRANIEASRRLTAGGLVLEGALVSLPDQRELTRFEAVLQPRDSMFGYAITGLTLS